MATLGVNNNESSDEEVEVSNLPILTNDSESDHEVIDNSIPEYRPPTKDNIQIGTFILVNVKFGKRGMSIYVYLAVIKNIKEKISTVTGCKSLDTTKQTFKLIKDDVFEVNLEQIQAVLKYPKVEGVEKCIKYKFSHSLDVREA